MQVYPIGIIYQLTVFVTFIVGSCGPQSNMIPQCKQPLSAAYALSGLWHCGQKYFIVSQKR